ncbi:glycosyltransferase family 2 protein [Tissierella sp.]|uniref:glycosyltransferase n=1 Tax=Tissierella sp. TaxID=41274 RepID=UPI00286DAA16|nr:glycosyltransferase family 2 protein [Tissierella sp.]
MSILVPCYNEALILKHTIQGLFNIEYDNFEVIFINDGSIDNTLEILNEILDLEQLEVSTLSLFPDEVKGIYKSNRYSFISVIDKYNSGKANSINIGALHSKHELIVTMDGDCVLEKDALESMNRTFHDEDIIASGGVVHIMQMFKLDGKQKLIVLMQALDYIKGFYIYKASLAYNDALSIISGAFGVFTKSILMEIGGFKVGLGEDIDITIRFQEYARNHNKKVVFDRNAICYTECPESLKGLISQRIRWQKGFIDAILNNSRFLFKNVFRSNVCFYMIIDALLSNSFATIVFLINGILVLMKVLYAYPLKTYIYILTTIVFNIIASIIAIKEAKKNVPHMKTRSLYFMIIFDMLFFQFLRIYFFIKGAVTYYFDNKHWHKVDRTNNDYNV